MCLKVAGKSACATDIIVNFLGISASHVSLFFVSVEAPATNLSLESFSEMMLLHAMHAHEIRRIDERISCILFSVERLM